MQIDQRKESIQEIETEDDDEEEDLVGTLTIQGYIIVRKDKKTNLEEAV